MVFNFDQFQYECDGWKRLIEFVRLENAHSKNRLSEIIKNNSEEDSEFLESAEFYQNYYIQQDVLLSMLSNDASEFDRLLEKEKYLDGSLLKKVIYERKKLKVEMEKVLNEFHNGKIRFNNFLEANS